MAIRSLYQCYTSILLRTLTIHTAASSAIFEKTERETVAGGVTIEI